MFVELWFDSPEAMEKSYASDAGKTAIADVPNCLSGAPTIIGVEQVTLAEPSISSGFQNHVKITFVAQKHPDLTWEEYQLFQLKKYAPNVLNGVVGIKGYEINIPSEDDPANPTSAVIHLWFDNKEAMQKGFSSPVMNVLKEYQKTMLKEPAVGSPIIEYVAMTPPTYFQDKKKSSKK